MTREYSRAVFVLTCVFALVLAAALLPAITGPFDRGPLESLVVDASPQTGAGQTGGSLGALNPGQSTSVGGLGGSGTGALNSQSAAVHFTVESSAPAYWRTGAYSTFTGTGWEQRDDSSDYDGPLSTRGPDGESVSYEVRLNRSATALPTVWRPRTVSADVDVSVTGRRAVRGDSALPAGTTYSAQSVQPVEDEAALRTASRDYPSSVVSRYTQLPEDTPDRLASFTDQLTEGEGTPYAKAQAIESWLEANKTYSLDAEAPDTEHIATTFAFEMDTGYCEYFATTMTAMLRTQGVPARYVVGYSTGQETSENTYTVRGMNAHAWVEVYVADVGWVKFDPTPGQARLATERQSLQEQRPDSPEYDPTEQGSPGETFTPDRPATDGTGVEGPENGSVANGTDANGTAPNGTDDPTAPGGSDSDTTVPGGGEGPGGGTGGVGTLPGTGPGPGAGGNGTLPGTGSSPGTGGENGTVANGTAPSGTDGSGPGTGGENVTDGSGPGGANASTGGTAGGTGNDSTDGTSMAGLSIALSSDPVPGSTVTVTVTRGEAPVPEAGILFDGDLVGYTDGNGTVTGEVPYSEQLNVTVRPPGDRGLSARGALPSVTAADVYSVAGPTTAVSNHTNQTRTYSVRTNATVSLSGTVATNRTVLLTAAVGSVAVPNATVSLAGERIGETDRSGRYRLTLPSDPGNYTVAVRRSPVAGNRTVTLAPLRVSVDPSSPVALPATPVTVTARLGNDTVAGVPVSVGGRQVGTTGINGTVTTTLPLSGSAAVSVSGYGQTASTTIDGLWRNAGIVLGTAALIVSVTVLVARRRGVGSTDIRRAIAAAAAAAVSTLVYVADLLVRIGAGLAASVRGAVGALAAYVRGQIDTTALRSLFVAWLGRVRADARAEVEAITPDRGRASTGDGDRPTIRAAWDDLLGRVAVDDPDTSTPGEVARHAVDREDLPEKPVHTVRDAFREVEYGARDAEDHLPAVEQALSDIDDEAEDDA